MFHQSPRPFGLRTTVCTVEKRYSLEVRPSNHPKHNCNQTSINTVEKRHDTRTHAHSRLLDNDELIQALGSVSSFPLRPISPNRSSFPTGDLSHLASIFILLRKIQTSRSCRGLPFRLAHRRVRTQRRFHRHLLQDASSLCHRLHHAVPRPVLPLTAFPLQHRHESLLHRQQRIHPLSNESSFSVRRHLAHYCPPYTSLPDPSHTALAFRPTNDPSIDTFRVEYLVGPALILALLFNYSYSLTEVFWSFSIFLESVAILPQLFILQRTGEAETITTHYLAALGAYRGLYIPNWIYRCVIVGLFSPRRLVVTYTGLSGRFTVILSRILSTQSQSWQDSCRQGSTSTSFMCTSPSTRLFTLWLS